MLAENEFALNTNELSEFDDNKVVKYLTDNKLIKVDEDYTLSSGFCTYPVAEALFLTEDGELKKK